MRLRAVLVKPVAAKKKLAAPRPVLARTMSAYGGIAILDLPRSFDERVWVIVVPDVDCNHADANPPVGSLASMENSPWCPECGSRYGATRDGMGWIRPRMLSPSKSKKRG